MNLHWKKSFVVNHIGTLIDEYLKTRNDTDRVIYQKVLKDFEQYLDDLESRANASYQAYLESKGSVR